jgi:uncharacterized protein
MPPEPQLAIEDARIWGLVAHLSGLMSVLVSWPVCWISVEVLSLGPFLSDDFGGLPAFQWAGQAVLLAFPLGSFLVWRRYRRRSDFVDSHGREACNFQLTSALVLLPWSPFFLFGFGASQAGGWLFRLLPEGPWGTIAILALWAVMFAIYVVFSFRAAFAANRGTRYRYPMTLRLIK